MFHGPFCFFQLIACIDGPADLNAYNLTVMRNFLMINDVEPLATALTALGFIRSEEHAGNPCFWAGVHCEDGHIKTFDPPRGAVVLHYGFMSSWMPPSLKMIRTPWQRSHQEFATRYMPWPLTVIEMDRCELRGSLDLTILPEDLHVMRLRDNLFSGTVRLVNLPKELRTLTLDGNRLEGFVVLNSAIPSFVQEYNVMFQKGKKRRVSAVCLDGDRVRTGILY